MDRDPYLHLHLHLQALNAAPEPEKLCRSDRIRIHKLPQSYCTGTFSYTVFSGIFLSLLCPLSVPNIGMVLTHTGSGTTIRHYVDLGDEIRNTLHVTGV